jgi:hypothetical protein
MANNIPNGQKYTKWPKIYQMANTYQMAENIPKWPKVYQMTIQYAKWQQDRRNVHKIYQQLSLQGTPKFTKIVIFGLKIGVPSGNTDFYYSD